MSEVTARDVFKYYGFDSLQHLSSKKYRTHSQSQWNSGADGWSIVEYKSSINCEEELNWLICFAKEHGEDSQIPSELLPWYLKAEVLENAKINREKLGEDMKITFNFKDKTWQVVSKKRQAVIAEFKTFTAARKFWKLNKFAKGVV